MKLNYTGINTRNMYKYFKVGLPRKCTWLKISDDTLNEHRASGCFPCENVKNKHYTCKEDIT